MQQALSRILRRRSVFIPAALLSLYALLGFLLLPYLVERNLPVYAQERLQRPASIGKVRVNPFLLTVEANEVRLQEADGQPLVAIQRLFVDFELSSLFRWAWTFADIQVTGLDLHYAIDSDGRSNLAKLADAFPPADPPETAPQPLRLLLQHVRLSAGRLGFSDRSLTTPANVTLGPIDLEFQNLSTLPERHAPCAIIATLPEGGTLVWRGDVALQPLASEGELYIRGFQPAAYWSFLQDRLRLAPPAGELEFYTRYRYGYSDGRSQLVLQRMQVNAAGIALSETGTQAPLLTLEQCAVSGGSFDLAGRELNLPKLALRNGRVTAELAQDGTLNWQRLVKPGMHSATEPATADTIPAPWRIHTDDLRLDALGAHVIDRRPAQGLTWEIGALDASTQLGVDIAPAAATVQAAALEARLTGLALRQAGRTPPLASLKALTLTGGRMDSGKRTAELAQLRLRAGDIDLALDAQGRLTLAEAFATGTPGTPPQQAAAGQPWKLQLARLQAEDFRARFSDPRYASALRYDLEKLSASVERLSSDAAQTASFEAAVTLAQGGALSGSGSFAPDGSRADAALQADKIGLTPLRSLIEHYTTLSLKSGTASAATRLHYARNGSAQLQVTGAASIDDLLLDETTSGDRFLAWQTLMTNDLEFDLAPDRVHIKQLRLVRPDAKILVFKDRSLNLGKVLKPRAEPAADSTAAKPAEDKAAFPVAVERIRIEQGRVDFSDLSLVLPFAAQIEELAGAVTGIASDPASRANLKLEGRVDQYGSVQVDGGLSPFAPKQYTDIRTRFRNVEMTPLSPYTATFAGRKVASGRLSLDLEYKVKDSQLSGDNKVVLEHFTLGEPIESPDALDLPLDLAIALLTDAQGRINAAVPVSGNVDKPDFSYGRLIGQALAGMLGKIVTAPFRALGGLLGGGTEKYDSVAFDAGSARLQPPQIETLTKVAQALQQRPQLRLVVVGRYDAQRDGVALRTEQVRRALAAALDIALEPDEEAPAAAVDQAKTQRELEKLLEARAGDQAVNTFKAGYEKTAGRAVEPVNPALALIGKASPDADYYEALFVHLVTLEPFDDRALPQLAQRRAEVIVQLLVTQAGLDPRRVAPGEIAAAPGGQDAQVDSKLRLESAPAPANAPAASGP